MYSSIIACKGACFQATCLELWKEPVLCVSASKSTYSSAGVSRDISFGFSLKRLLNSSSDSSASLSILFLEDFGCFSGVMSSFLAYKNSWSLLIAEKDLE